MIKFDKVTREEFKKKYYSRNNLQAFLKRFEESKDDAIKINWAESGYYSAAVCSSSIREAVKKSGRNMDCFMCDGEVYLVKILYNI